MKAVKRTIVAIVLLLVPCILSSADRRIEQVKDRRESPLLRAALVKQLGKDKVKESAPVLLEILRNSSDDYKLRIACATALGELEHEEAVPVFLDIIKNEEDDYEVKISCANAVSYYNKKEYLLQLGSVVSNIRDFKGDISSAILEAILKSKFKKEKDILLIVGSLITHRKPENRKKVITILTDSNDKYALQFLMVGMEDKAPSVRELAIQSVAKIGGKIAVPAMIDLLEEEKKEDIKDKVADILNKIEVGPIKKVWIESLTKRIEEETNAKIKLKLKTALERLIKAQKK